MGIKDLFGNNPLSKPIPADTLERLSREVESVSHIERRLEEKNRFVPQVNYASASSFAKYGSAEKYYESAVSRIYNQYPYDGSKAETKQFFNESSYLDLYVFDKRYPRTTGFINLGLTSMAHDNKLDGWGYSPTTSEYIEILGGPHTSSGGLVGKDLSTAFGDPTYRTSPNSNIYDTDIYTTANTLADERAGSRESNLKYNLSDGLTVEFWLKKEAWTTSNTDKEVIFDLWNGTPTGSTDGSYAPRDDYGRLLIYMSGGASSGNAIRIHAASGATVWDQAIGDTSFTSDSVADNEWQHYAISFASSSADNQLQAKFYISGNLYSQHTADTGAFNEVTGTLKARIGALQTTPSGNIYHGVSLADGAKLSASLDEFRFWKTKRTSKDIGRNWFTQVGGGTNNDIANADLGFYFKFNEGTIGDSAVDSTVLDYSGRISNGNWVGYPGVTARNSGSAMVLASASCAEFRDPIIYPTHPDVESVEYQLKTSGSTYDLTNPASLYYSLPSFMPDEDENSTLHELTQIIASYLDTLHLQVEALPRLKDAYFLSSSFKPLPFANRTLESHGFFAPEIFANADFLAQIGNRDEVREFELDLHEVKNRIYKNIYNVLIHLYKSKGTEAAFRNLIRAFGVDEELIKINLYGNNVTNTINDNVKFTATRTKTVNFNTSDNFYGTVVQWTGSTSNPNATDTSFLSGGADVLAAGINWNARTAEVQVLFPRKPSFDQEDYFSTPFLSSSIFGHHSVAEQAPKLNEWIASAADHNFSLYAVRPELESKDAYFILKSRSGDFLLTSSLYKDVYDNQKWNFAVRTRHANYSHPVAQAPAVSGAIHHTTSSADGTSKLSSHVLEFYGVNTDLDIVKNEFCITASELHRLNHIGTRKYYVGAERENYTGSLQKFSDVRAISMRHWESYVDNDSIKAHAKDPHNFGTSNPHRATHFKNTGSLDGVWLPEYETLALHWNFDNVTGSDALGMFLVDDVSSGSVDLRTRYPGYVGELVGNQYPGLGYGFLASNTSSIDVNYVPTAKLQPPEIMNSIDMVSVVERDDNKFTRESRPINYFFAFEKSMYQTISEEMLKMFATIVEFSNLFGRPVDKYRTEYKDLAKLRELFFERIGETPSLEKYVSYYKWVDGALGQMLQQLVPASADVSDGIRTMVESHELERNKYRHKFPNIKHVEPDFVGHIKGIEEGLYDWEHGHAPTNLNYTSGNCLWWHDRAERSLVTSSISFNSHANQQRDTIKDISISHISGTGPNLAQSDKTVYTGSAYALRKFTKIYRFTPSLTKPIHGGSNYGLSLPGLSNQKPDFVNATADYDATHMTIDSIVSSSKEACEDHTTPYATRKVRKIYDIYSLDDEDASTDFDYYRTKGSLIAPFTMHSSSVSTGYQADLMTLGNIDITNMHSDVYGDDYEVPMQGPFTEKFVGGNQHRHVDLNSGSDDIVNRPERFWLKPPSTTAMVIRSQRTPTTMHHPDARYYRDEVAKRPVNIRNIKMTTGSTNVPRTRFISGTLNAAIGNYTRDYEVVQTSDRRVNNKSFVRQEGFSTASITYYAYSYYNGLIDYLKPERERHEHIFVERFSAPGDPATMGDHQGGPGLDYESAQFSPYNEINTRNATVRVPLNTLHTERSEKFGFRSGSSATAADYSGTGSIHKVHRNGLRRYEYETDSVLDAAAGTVITASTYDNFYVQHPIPRFDGQYSWISASLLSASELGHVARMDGLYSSSSGIDSSLKFVTGAASSSADEYFVDFAGLNTYIYEPVSSAYGELGYPVGTEGTAYLTASNSALLPAGTTAVSPGFYLNGLMAHRGNRGYPSWRQIRVGENPVVRNWKKNNLYVLNTGGISIAVHEDPYYTYRNVGGTLVSFQEPPVVRVHYPIEYGLSYTDIEGVITSTDIKGTYGNLIDYFANPELEDATRDCLVTPPCPETQITTLYKGAVNVRPGPTDELDFIREPMSSFGSAGKNLFDTDKWRAAWDNAKKISSEYQARRPKLNSLKLTQVVYPKAQYAYLSKVRQRDNYSNNFWRAIRAGRVTTTKWNNTYYDGTYSRWNLDEETTFLTNTIFGGQIGKDDDSGILQNNRTHCMRSPAHFNEVTATILYSLKHTLPNSGSVDSPASPDPDLSAGVDVSVAKLMGYVVPTYGQAKWEAGTQAGYWDINGNWASQSSSPFSDSYKDYASDLRLLNKDYSIVPEFRISDHIDYYMKTQGGNFLASLSGAFSIFGASTSGTVPQNNNDEEFYKIFTNSEFMRHFEKVRDEHDEIVDPSALTLRCKAIMKFHPYDGFYPSELLGNLFKSFSGSYFDDVRSASNIANFTSNYENAMRRPFCTPFFSPGIWNNMVKSGIAVDYATTSGAFTIHKPLWEPDGTATNFFLMGSSSYPKQDASGALLGWDFRVPFEAIVEPEKYVANQVFTDMFPYPSASLDLSSSWGGEGDSLYKMRASNALASMVEFFLPGPDNKGQLASLVSRPEKEFGTFRRGNYYGMRVKMRKSYNIPRQAATRFNRGYITPNDSLSDIFDKGLRESFTMYGRPSAFGPPVSGRGHLSLSASATSYKGLREYDSLLGVNPSWTPCYKDGEAWADFIYKHDFDGQPTLDQILSASTVMSWRFDPLHSGYGDNSKPYGHDNINLFSMQLSSSVNLFGTAKLKNVEYDSDGREIKIVEDDSNRSKAWVIQPKMETPMLNFVSASRTLPAYGSESTDIGMWHQFGRLPRSPKEGIFLEVSDIDPGWLERRVPLFASSSHGVGSDTPPGRDYSGYKTTYNNGDISSLVDMVKFDKKSVKLGQLAKRRKIKEAVVAVPYIQVGNRRNFFRIPKREVNAAKRVIEGKSTSVLVGKSIVNMLYKMENYVFPPTMDFLKYPEEVDPIAMYIFEFEHEFDQNDLSYIWQNLRPPSAHKFKTATSTINHKLLINELMGSMAKSTQRPLQERLRWMVFKVKQKANWDYFSKVVQNNTDADTRYRKDFNIGRTRTISTSPLADYSYNWPYDNCSLIEFVKLESEVRFDDNFDSQEEQLRPKTKLKNTRDLSEKQAIDNIRKSSAQLPSPSPESPRPDSTPLGTTQAPARASATKPKSAARTTQIGLGKNKAKDMGDY